MALFSARVAAALPASQQKRRLEESAVGCKVPQPSCSFHGPPWRAAQADAPDASWRSVIPPAGGAAPFGRCKSHVALSPAEARLAPALHVSSRILRSLA